jgi:hypothetical protein
LVYKQERVEGYTNFSMGDADGAFKGLFGIDYLLTSRFLVSSQALCLHCVPAEEPLPAIAMVDLRLCPHAVEHPVLAYWSVASLKPRFAVWHWLRW